MAIWRSAWTVSIQVNNRGWAGLGCFGATSDKVTGEIARERSWATVLEDEAVDRRTA